MDYAKEGDIEMVWSHSGAVTGLKMLLKELDGEVEYQVIWMTEKEWYILCYCDDIIEAENEDEAYKIFCKKHNFGEEDAEFVSYAEVDEDD